MRKIFVYSSVCHYRGLGCLHKYHMPLSISTLHHHTTIHHHHPGASTSIYPSPSPIITLASSSLPTLVRGNGGIVCKVVASTIPCTGKARSWSYPLLERRSRTISDDRQHRRRSVRCQPTQHNSIPSQWIIDAAFADRSSIPKIVHINNRS